MSMCAVVLRSSPARWGDVPFPGDAKAMVPGFAFAAAMHLLQRLVRRVCRGTQHERAAADQDHRLERFHRVVRHARIDARVDRVRADRAAEDRVAVRLRLCHEIGADVAARAGLVLDDDGLAQSRGELLADEAREGVRVAADGERNDVRDRLGRPLLGDGRRMTPRQAPRTRVVPIDAPIQFLNMRALLE